MRCYYLVEDDPCTNLATESALFHHPPTMPLVLLYRCRPAVIIGRNQNPWNEIQLSYVQKHRIPCFRRESGGGAVYHDLGNINFSFILPRGLHVAKHNLTIVVRMLHQLGVIARHTERNDILVHGKKISGSAFRYREDRVLHHGTLLCKANLTHLRGALISEKSPVTDGVVVRSNPMSVTNVAQYTNMRVQRILCILRRELLREHSLCRDSGERAAEMGKKVFFSPLSPTQLTDTQRVFFAHAHQQLSSWRWRVAKTPPCSFSIMQELCCLKFKVVDGHLTDVAIHLSHPKHQKIATLCKNYLSNMRVHAQSVMQIHSLQRHLRTLLGSRDHAYKNIVLIIKKLLQICRI